MTFVSLAFFVLLFVTYILYWMTGRRVQNLLLLIASLVSYGWWDWRFLGLMLYSTWIDYLCGLALIDPKKRIPPRLVVAFAVINNLTILGFFKYYDFFALSLQAAFHSLGYEVSFVTLNLILPVGISFYTFQTMSYTIDIYQGKLTPSTDFIEFASFVSFFPQLVAGPIERAATLLDQFKVDRTFNMTLAKDGLRQSLWGFFKKVFVADVLAQYLDPIYITYEHQSGSMLAYATVLFAFQIYADFSAYSDIAIGTSKLFGFDIIRNFAYPYYSRDMNEFWHRWHMSLSTWFLDYVYVPMGGNRKGNARRMFNVMFTFVVSGLWHGANWTFVVWGYLNGVLVLFMPRVAPKGAQPGSERLRDLPAILFTFAITCLCWVYFRSRTFTEANIILLKIFTDFHVVEFFTSLGSVAFWFAPMIVFEWMQRKKLHALEIEFMPLWARWSIYVVIILAMYLFGAPNADAAFIYFQF